MVLIYFVYFLLAYLSFIIAIMMIYSIFLILYMFGLSIHQYIFTCLEIFIDSLLHPPRFFWSLYVYFFPEQQVEEQEEQVEQVIEEVIDEVILIINPSGDIKLGVNHI